MPTYQLIVSTMNQTDDSLIQKMNINSDAIIINQADRVEYHEVKEKGNIIKIYSFNERGVGLSRNSGYMRADADIIQFADDDMVFTDTYKTDVLNEYRKHPEADVILFSNIWVSKDRTPYEVKKFGRVGRIEGVIFGGARITARRESLLYNNISFPLLFGGGARYAAGEDVTFIQDCLKAGLRVYKSPVIVSTINQNGSTWFNGYTEKYYKDKGALLAANFPAISRVGALVQALRKCRGSEWTFKQLYGFYKSGVDEYRRNQYARGRKEK